MKTLNTFTVALMMVLSLNTYAGDKTKMTEKNKNSLVAVAPFVWGDPEDGLTVEDKMKLLVPQAPFIWGDPDNTIPGATEVL